jgi:hypothetical protein
MARPRKIDDSFVHRIAGLIRAADTIQRQIEEVLSAIAQAGIKVEKADAKFLIGDLVNIRRLIHEAVGRFICGEVGRKHLTPEKRTYLLRRLINAQEGNKKRKTPPDEISLVRRSVAKARAKLTDFNRGDDPTFKEADAQFYEDNGWHLDRRAIKDAR